MFFFTFFNVKPNENLVHLEILWYSHVLKDVLKPAETCWSRIWWIYDGSSTVHVKSTDLSVPCVPEACFGSFDCPGLCQIMVFTWFLCGSSWPGTAIDAGRVAPGFTSLKCSGWRWTSTFHLCLRTQECAVFKRSSAFFRLEDSADSAVAIRSLIGRVFAKHAKVQCLLHPSFCLHSSGTVKSWSMICLMTCWGWLCNKILYDINIYYILMCPTHTQTPLHHWLHKWSGFPDGCLCFSLARAPAACSTRKRLHRLCVRSFGGPMIAYRSQWFHWFQWHM